MNQSIWTWAIGLLVVSCSYGTAIAPAERGGLGTAWGETRASRVDRVDFERDDPERPLAVAVLYYDDQESIRALAAGTPPWAEPGWGAPFPGDMLGVRLVDAWGAPLPVFSRAGRQYVEGRRGERYAIEVDNRSDARVEVVATVDGLDVIDGRRGSLDKPGYVLDPGTVWRIDGFRRNLYQVAAFRFGGVGDSYAAEKGDDTNVGVVGVAFFAERPRIHGMSYKGRMRPPAPPAPLRTDGSNAFAHYSMSVRVPKILEEVSARNPDYAPTIHQAIARLRDDIRGNAPLPALAFPAPDAAEWEPGLAARAGETWLGTDWFFAECYVYRCLMSAVRYWETGRDPFAPAKREELASDALWESVARAAPETQVMSERVRALLARALWGNRVDLSYAVGVAFGAAGQGDDLLADDSAVAADRLLHPPRDVHIIADNTGSELAMDLLLADVLLTETTPAEPRPRVSLHVKMHPTFVSDAIAPDVWALVDAFAQRGGTAGQVAANLRQAWADRRLRVLPDPIWNGPRFLWERPPRLQRELDSATAVILKGDANYRRASGDALWPAGISFAEATRYFPAPLVAVRTMKSDSVVGISAEHITRLDAADADWRINGRRGVIQVGGRGAV